MDRSRTLEVAAGVDAEVGRRLAFVYELDRLKGVLRRTLTLEGERRENSAEHSWHLALTALVLAPFADEPLDLDRVIRILLVHDVVEIDAGDVFVYDEAARAEIEATEREAADRIFGLLPDPDGAELRALWDEYEQSATPEARFAYACDRLQPLLLNLATGGGSWRDHGITLDRVSEINGRIAQGSGRLWAVARALLQAAVDDGDLAR
ncbi:MAG: HD family hydrolase [Acidimicrobiales bacterium]